MKSLFVAVVVLLAGCGIHGATVPPTRCGSTMECRKCEEVKVNTQCDSDEAHGPGITSTAAPIL